MGAAPQRPTSDVYARPPVGPLGAPPPSTLPPAPFANEEDVVGLEWWLDAHMALASQLAWLEQVIDVGGAVAGTSTVRLLAEQAGTVRDALYELYCDAADPRLASLAVPGLDLERYVTSSYAWCEQIIDLLAGLATSLRSPGGVDWATTKAGFRAAASQYVPPSDALRDGIRALSIDTKDRGEPLRNLPHDLEALFAATGELQAALAPRFA